MVWRAARAGRYTDTEEGREALRRDACRGPRRAAALVTGGIFAVFLLLSAFAPGAMTAPLPGGGVPAGVMAGLLHPPFTVAVLWWYERTAGRREREVAR